MASLPNCRICGLAVAEFEQSRSESLFYVTCLRCGKYRMTETLYEDASSLLGPETRPALMAAVAAANERGVEPLLKVDTWEQAASEFLGFTIPQKLRRLLEYVGRKSKGLAGARVRVVGDMDFPKVAARDQGEYHWLRSALQSQGLLEIKGDDLSLTLQGWEAYGPSRGGAPGTCFVAMSFDPELNAAFEQGIEPAVIKDCGFLTVRLDRVEHNGNINDRIIADIRACQFMVADFTFHRNGVYFEAGFALGLGRQVIWTCRRDQMKDAHFDARPYNHIVWDAPNELREKLANRIKATVLG